MHIVEAWRSMTDLDLEIHLNMCETKVCQYVYKAR